MFERSVGLIRMCDNCDRRGNNISRHLNHFPVKNCAIRRKNAEEGTFSLKNVVGGEKNVWRLEHILEHFGGAELGEAGYMDAVIGEDGT